MSKRITLSLAIILSIPSIAFAAYGNVISLASIEGYKTKSKGVSKVVITGTAESIETEAKASKVEQLFAHAILYRNGSRVKASSGYDDYTTYLSKSVSYEEYGSAEYSLYSNAKAVYTDGTVDTDEDIVTKYFSAD